MNSRTAPSSPHSMHDLVQCDMFFVLNEKNMSGLLRNLPIVELDLDPELYYVCPTTSPSGHRNCFIQEKEKERREEEI